MLSESNSVLPQWKREFISEEVRREYNEFYDTQIRTIVNAYEKLHKGSTLRRKDTKGERRNRISGLEAGLNFWEEQLQLPGLPVSVIYIGKRRITQLQEQLDKIREAESPS